MRRIFTLYIALVCLFFNQDLFAQCAYTTATAAPTNSPAYTSIIPNTLSSVTNNSTVPSGAGWYTNLAAGTYKALQLATVSTGINRLANQTGSSGDGTYRLYSSIYYYNTSTSSTKFYVAVNTANEGNSVDVNFANISIFYGPSATPITLCTTAPTTAFAQAKNTTYYYAFNLSLPSTLPASTNFRIGLDLIVNGQAGTGNYLYISDFGVTSTTTANIASGTLPVHFSAVTVRKATEGALVTWNVSTEQNVSGYDVEKSVDGRNFTKVGFLAASGQSTYSFTDTKSGALNFYRVKSVDIDGKFGYSTVVSLNGDNASVVVKAFMSDKNTLTVQHDAATAGAYISVISMDGQVIKVQQPTTGAQQTNVDLSAAQTGLYIVRYDNGRGSTQSIKVAK